MKNDRAPSVDLTANGVNLQSTPSRLSGSFVDVAVACVFSLMSPRWESLRLGDDLKPRLFYFFSVSLIIAGRAICPNGES